MNNPLVSEDARRRFASGLYRLGDRLDGLRKGAPELPTEVLLREVHRAQSKPLSNLYRASSMLPKKGVRLEYEAMRGVCSAIRLYLDAAEDLLLTEDREGARRMIYLASIICKSSWELPI